jgi:hypothetical protein
VFRGKDIPERKLRGYHFSQAVTDPTLPAESRKEDRNSAKTTMGTKTNLACLQKGKDVSRLSP